MLRNLGFLARARGPVAKLGLVALVSAAGSAVVGVSPAFAGGPGSSLATIYSTKSAGGMIAVAADQYGDVIWSGRNGIELDGPDGMQLPLVGGGSTAVGKTPIPITNVKIGYPAGVAFDPKTDNIYIADAQYGQVDEISVTTDKIWKIAGGGTAAPSTTAAPATSVKLASPLGIAADKAGDVFVSETPTSGTKEIDEITGGQLSVIAGGGVVPPSPVAVTATAVSLTRPAGLAVDGAGDLYVADSNYLEKISGGNLSVIAGGGSTPATTTAQSATGIALGNATGVALDRAGNVFVSDAGNSGSSIPSSLIEVAGGNATVVAGDGTTTPYSSTYSAALNPTSVKFSALGGIAITPAGTTYVVDAGYGSLFGIAPAPTLTKVQPATGVPSGSTVTIYGTNLTETKQISFGGKPAPLFLCGTTSCLVLMTPAHSVGTVPVTVTTLYGTSLVTTSTHFTYKKATSTTKLKASESTAVYGKESREHLKITVSSNAAPATGTVSLQGAKCTKTLKMGAAVCTLGEKALAPGKHILKATYKGNGDLLGSVSKPVTILVKR